jgi:hypothetical protein
METNNFDIEKRTFELVQKQGLENPSDVFLQNVMSVVNNQIIIEPVKRNYKYWWISVGIVIISLIPVLILYPNVLHSIFLGATTYVDSIVITVNSSIAYYFNLKLINLSSVSVYGGLAVVILVLIEVLNSKMKRTLNFF